MNIKSINPAINVSNPNFSATANIKILRNANKDKWRFWNDVSDILTKYHEPHLVTNEGFILMSPTDSKNIEPMLKDLTKEGINIDRTI